MAAVSRTPVFCEQKLGRYIASNKRVKEDERSDNGYQLLCASERCLSAPRHMFRRWSFGDFGEMRQPSAELHLDENEGVGCVDG